MKKILSIFLVVLFLGSFAFASDEKVAVIKYAGDAKVVPAGKTEPLQCRPKMLLEKGSKIITGEEAYVELAFDNNQDNIVRVGENSEVIVKIEGPDKIELIDGKVFSNLQNLKDGKTFRVRTPEAVCGARGTAWETETNSGVTNIAVLRDNVFVRGVNKDGSVMEEEKWISEKFELSVEKYHQPGDPEGIPNGEFSRMEKKYGLLTAPNRKKHMIEGIEKSQSIREEYRERVLDQREEKKVEEKEDRRGSSGDGERRFTTGR